MRTALAVLCTCVLFALGAFVGPAQAGGGYRSYDDGYYPRGHHGDVWYSSKCCYKKIVRHVRQVRYVRVDPYRRHGYYGPYRPWREGYYGQPSSYYGRPASYTEVYVGGPPPRYGDYPPPPPPRWNGHNGGYNGGYDAYNAAGVDVAPTCYRRRAPVLDGRGGWVWGFKQVCD